MVIPSLQQLVKPQYVTRGIYCYNNLGFILKISFQIPTVQLIPMLLCWVILFARIVVVQYPQVFFLSRVLDNRGPYKAQEHVIATFICLWEGGSPQTDVMCD